MKQKHTILITLLIVLLVFTFPAQATKFNVLFIPIDDLKPFLGCYGNKQIKTPNIDNIAKRGTVFLNASCQQAICGPSRASIMTGMYPDYTKVWDLGTKMRKKNPNILTLPQYFKQQGYNTTGLGKTFDSRCVDNRINHDKPSWSIPYSSEKIIKSRKAYFRDWINPKTHEAIKKAEKKVKGMKFKFGYQRQQKMAETGGPMTFPTTESMDVPDDAYFDGAMAEAGMKLLEKLAKSKKPFFISLGFQKPHLPFVAPKKYWNLYDRSSISPAPYREKTLNAPSFAFQDSWELRGYSDVPRKGPVPIDKQKQMIHGYMASVSYVDAQIGKIINKLKELGIEDNTIICLWGDHGFHLGDHGMFCKHTNYEQAVRSPLIIAAPKGFTANKTNAPTEFVDVFPTLCELAGLKIPSHLQGKSLTSVMKNPDSQLREAALSQYPRTPQGRNIMGYTLRAKRYRYVKWLEMDFKKGERIGELAGTELYDYHKDPFEKVNQAGNPKYKAIVDRFERLFKQRNIAQNK